MNGLGLLSKELEKDNIEIDQKTISTSQDESNGNVILVRKTDGKSVSLNIFKLATIYGTIAFFHMEQDGAIKEIASLIKDKFEEKNGN